MLWWKQWPKVFEPSNQRMLFVPLYWEKQRNNVFTLNQISKSRLNLWKVLSKLQFIFLWRAFSYILRKLSHIHANCGPEPERSSIMQDFQRIISHFAPHAVRTKIGMLKISISSWILFSSGISQTHTFLREVFSIDYKSCHSILFKFLR